MKKNNVQFTWCRRDNFVSHRSFCNARHTINSSPCSLSAGVLTNASNSAGSINLGLAAGSLISPGNHQQLPSLSSNMSNLGFNGNNSFSGLLMNADQASAYNILNSTPYNPHLSATALLQKATLTGANYNNAVLMNSMYGGALGGGMSGGGRGGGSSFQAMYNNWNVGGVIYGSNSGDQMNALGDGMSGGGSSFQDMYNNFNAGGGSYGRTRGYGGGMEYFGDQMNASYGGMNADGMLVGEVNNNVLVEPQMNVQSDKLTRDFLGIGNGMNSFSFSGGGVANDYDGNGMGTNSPDSEATISAEVGPFVPGRRPDF